MISASFHELAAMTAVPSDAAWIRLERFGSRLSGAVKVAIRDRRLVSVHVPAWSDGEAALRRLFGCDRASHCFHETPHSWLSLIETQMTGGVAHFLNAGNLIQRRKRTAAFFEACGIESIEPSSLGRVGAIAEERIKDGRRLDLVVYACADDRDRLIVVEGKLGAELGSGQLSAYRRALTAIAKTHHLEVKPADSTLLVVGNRVSRRGRAGLKRNKAWQFISWRDVMQAFDRTIGDADDIEFRRFRRTVWERCR